MIGWSTKRQASPRLQQENCTKTIPTNWKRSLKGLLCRKKCDSPSLLDFIQYTLYLVILRWGQLNWLVIIAKPQEPVRFSVLLKDTDKDRVGAVILEQWDAFSKYQDALLHIFVSQVSILHCCHCVLDPMATSLLMYSVSHACSGILSLF